MSEFKYGALVGVIADNDEDGMWLYLPHFVGLTTPPTAETLQSLEQELRSDPEFGFVGADWSKVVIFSAPERLIELFSTKVPPEEWACSKRKIACELRHQIGDGDDT